MPRAFANTLFSPAALARFFLVAAIGLTADLWTKSRAVSELSGVPSAEIIHGWLGDAQLTKDAHPDGVKVVDFVHGWLQFEFIENPGAVFGIAPGKRMMFLVVSVLAVVFLTYLFSASGGKWYYQIILGMLLAGVLGNMYDRASDAEKVRDMIHMLPGWHWPGSVRHVLKFLPDEVFPYIFNVADTLLCTGVGLMLVYSFFNTPDEKPAKLQTAKA
jgi:signal peptidase II